MTKEQVVEVIEYIKDHFDIQQLEERGVFVRKKKTQGGHITGYPIKTKNNSGYIVINVLGKQHLAHRLVYIWFNGWIGDDVVSHKTHNKTDNRISNLSRSSTHTASLKHSRSSRNSSGVCGLYRINHGYGDRWQAKVILKGRSYTKTLPFTNAGKNAAIDWLKEKRKDLGFSPVHGMPT